MFLHAAKYDAVLSPRTCSKHIVNNTFRERERERDEKKNPELFLDFGETCHQYADCNIFFL
jgi:hypothetical protein